MTHEQLVKWHSAEHIFAFAECITRGEFLSDVHDEYRLAAAGVLYTLVIGLKTDSDSVLRDSLTHFVRTVQPGFDDNDPIFPPQG